MPIGLFGSDPHATPLPPSTLRWPCACVPRVRAETGLDGRATPIHAPPMTAGTSFPAHSPWSRHLFDPSGVDGARGRHGPRVSPGGMGTGT